MPLFQYSALQTSGKEIRGVIDADSLEQAKERLIGRDVIVTKIALAKKDRRHALSKETVIHFTRDLAGLLHSGLPLYESLLTIEEKYRSHKSHFVFLDLCDQVKQGRALSRALLCYPDSFDLVYISMVSAGESTGSLEKAFFELYKVISRTEKFRKQVISSMVYPAFLSVFCLAVLAGLFLFLIPSMQELLEDRKLHPMTELILQMSKGLRAHLPFVGVTLLGTTIAIFWLTRLQRVRNLWKRTLLKIPLIKTIIIEMTLMRFARVLAVLLSSGVPILEALKLAKSVMNHVSFEEVITRAEEGIVEGRKLSEELKKSTLFPPLMIRMLATSEETGNPSEMLSHVANIYEEELERTLLQFTSLLQPVMLLVLGVIVAVVLLSVLLPLTDVSTLL